MAVAITVVAASTPAGANRLTVTGLAGLQVISVRRTYSGKSDQITGTLTADAAGALTYDDYLYPLDVTVTYTVYDASGTTVLATSAPVTAVPSGGRPWIRDTVFPGNRFAAVTIVDIADRVRPGRVTVYNVAAQWSQVTVGDIRLSSNGTIQLLCPTHTDRDTVIYAMSSGSPCMLRVPAGCRTIVDEMAFTPLDITETRFGIHGAVVLTVEFVEVSVTRIGTFVPVTYGKQASNAAAVAMTYGTIGPPASGLAAAFLGKNYNDMYVSQTGIAP